LRKRQALKQPNAGAAAHATGAIAIALGVTARDICGQRAHPQGSASSRQGETTMLRIHFAGVTTAIIASALAATAQAQQQAPAPFATTKVTDNESYADAQKEIKLPKYEAWPNYNTFLPMNIERYFDFWNRGI